MGNGIPDDWYIEHSGESRILDQDKVAAALEALRCIADFEQDIHVKDADAISYMRNTAKQGLGR